MTLSLALVADFVLIMARSMAWMYAAPVFSEKGFSTFARTTTALGLAFFLTPLLGPSGLSLSSGPASTLGGYTLLAVGQIAAGLVMGWTATVLLSAFEAAGSLIDVNSGFSLASLFDPQMGVQVTVFSRFARLLFVTLLFATGAHRQLVAGFVRSFGVVPLDSLPRFNFDIPVLVGLVSTMLLASLQIAAPVLGAVFLTEVTLAIAQRFAPTANMFVLGLPAKTLITLLVLGSSLMFYPMFIERLVSMSLGAANTLFGG